MMAAAFKIDCEWDRHALYLQLLGDFDEDSACGLIETLKEHCHDASVIFIVTRDLTHIDPSACDAFQEKLHELKDFCYRLVFVGRNADWIRPKWTEYF